MQAVCDKYDVFMIADEVICGFGRLGAMFGCEKLGFGPHRSRSPRRCPRPICRSPAVMVPEKMYQALLDREPQDRHCSATALPIRGHPVAAAVAVKTLEIYARDASSIEVSRLAPHSRPAAGARRTSAGRRSARPRPDRRRRARRRQNTKRSFARSTASPREPCGAQAEGLIVRACSAMLSLVVRR